MSYSTCADCDREHHTADYRVDSDGGAHCPETVFASCDNCGWRGPAGLLVDGVYCPLTSDH